MPRPRVKNYIIFAVAALAGALLIGTTIIALVGLHDQPGNADIALVLGSKVELDGKPSPRLQARLDKTIELYQAGYFPAVIASGGIGKEGFDEALVMSDYLVAHGMPKERVIVDSTGVTTFASAKSTAMIVRQQKLRSVFVMGLSSFTRR